MTFEKFTTYLNGNKITVDINTDTHFISDAWMEGNEDWMPNGRERKSIVASYLRRKQMAEKYTTPDQIVQHIKTDTINSIIGNPKWKQE